MSGSKNRTEQDAYEEMTAAAKTIAERIKEYPALLDTLCTEIELALIKIAMDRSDGNCSHAAKLLGINRTTLVEKRRKFRLPLQRLNERTLPKL